MKAKLLDMERERERETVDCSKTDLGYVKTWVKFDKNAFDRAKTKPLCSQEEMPTVEKIDSTLVMTKHCRTRMFKLHGFTSVVSPAVLQVLAHRASYKNEHSGRFASSLSLPPAEFFRPAGPGRAIFVAMGSTKVSKQYPEHHHNPPLCRRSGLLGEGGVSLENMFGQHPLLGH